MLSVALALAWLPGAAAQAPDAAVGRDPPVVAEPADGARSEAAAPNGAAAPGEAAGTAPEGSAGPDLDPATLERVIGVLEDEARREEVLATLRALAAVDATAPPKTLTTAPMDWLRQQVDRRSAMLLQTLDAVIASLENVGAFGDWLSEQVSSPLRRAFWLRTLRELGLVLGGSLVVALGAWRLLRDVRGRVAAYVPPTPFHLAAGLVLNVALRLVPVASFVAAALVIGQALDLGPYTRAVGLALVTGLAFVTAVTALIRASINHENPALGLLGVSPESGGVLERGMIRIVALGGYGYYSLEAARALGLPWTLHGFLTHLLFLATLLLYVRLVLRFRREGAEGFAALAVAGSGGILARFLPWRRVAAIWHWGAILFGLAIYGAWALQVEGGPGFLVRGIALTLLILVLSRLIQVWLTERPRPRAPDRAGEDGEEAEVAELVGAAAAAPLTFLWSGVTTVATLVLILQVWGVDVLGLLASDLARNLREAAVTSAITLGLAYLLWRALSFVIRNAIEEKDALGRPIRSNRARTLLTIGRNLAFVLIWLTAGLMVLNELGVNLAPLLAGAGVIGLAVGFGSQQLVRDIITGFFILVEDVVAVGDVAELAGKSGVVEAVTLRTVRLRAYDGQVHTIPYSSIDVISNFTKEFSYYVFDVGVAYKEDIDRVIDVMREIGAEMQRDRAFRRLILEPLDVAGVDRFADSAVVIRARIKTRPLQQWTVGREFNRRLKRRFDQLGIEIPFPQRTVHVSVPGAVVGAAPPAPPARAS